ILQIQHLHHHAGRRTLVDVPEQEHYPILEQQLVDGHLSGALVLDRVHLSAFTPAGPLSRVGSRRTAPGSYCPIAAPSGLHRLSPAESSPCALSLTLAPRDR